MKDSFVYIRHIVDSIKKIEKYISGMSYDDFRKNDQVMDAVIRNIEIIGEASSKCTLEFRKKYPQIPWREMSDTRNKVIHDYMGVSIEIIWEICKEELPPVMGKLENLLQNK